MVYPSKFLVPGGEYVTGDATIVPFTFFTSRICHIFSLWVPFSLQILQPPLFSHLFPSSTYETSISPLNNCPAWDDWPILFHIIPIFQPSSNHLPTILFHTHRIHVWNIYQHLPHIWPKCRQIYQYIPAPWILWDIFYAIFTSPKRFRKKNVTHESLGPSRYMDYLVPRPWLFYLMGLTHDSGSKRSITMSPSRFRGSMSLRHSIIPWSRQKIFHGDSTKKRAGI